MKVSDLIKALAGRDPASPVVFVDHQGTAHEVTTNAGVLDKYGCTMLRISPCQHPRYRRS